MAVINRARSIAVAGLTSLALITPMEGVERSSAAAAPAPQAATAAAEAASASVVTKKSKRRLSSRQRAKRVYKTGKRYRGVPYRYGGSSPRGFDCSGFTQYVYRKQGVSIPRVASAQRSRAKRVSRSQARKGDLVFFHGRGGVYHVGIYAGKNRVLHAPRTGRRVSTERIWTSSVSFGRYV